MKPAPPKPPRPHARAPLPDIDIVFPPEEIDTDETDVQTRLAAGILNVFESLPGLHDQQLLVELVSTFGAAGRLRSTVVAVARAVVEHEPR